MTGVVSSSVAARGKKPVRSLRTKFVQTMLFVGGLISLSALGTLAFVSVQTSSEHLHAVQLYIAEGISSKGKVLTENHARALRGLALDNSFVDMQRLVERAVNEDPDVVYGLYLNAEGQARAYARRGAPVSNSVNIGANAWRELDLSPAELRVLTLEIQRRARLGQDLLEIAMPVVGEEQEVLGSVRYGLSTHRMHDALVLAQSEANSRLIRSVLSMACLVGFFTLLGMLLSRVQAGRITRPIDELTLAAEGLASGDRSVRVRTDSGDEVELLGASFNRMVEDLDRSYRELEGMNHTLEHKVKERTLELAHKNRDMRLVLDNVDQGFVTLSKDGTMTLERSRVVNEWFGHCDKPLHFGDYIGRFAPSFGVQFQLGWTQVTDDFLPLDAALAQLPERLSGGGRTFGIRYLPFHQGPELEGVLLVIDDITERLQKERDEAEQGELMQSFKRLMRDHNRFNAFVREASEMVGAICARRLDADLVVLRRTLHTLKGNSASMGLAVVARLCHMLEDQIAEDKVTSDETLAELGERWNTIVAHITSFSGNGNRRVIEVPEDEYAALISWLSSEAHVQREVWQQVLSWQLEPVARPLHGLAEQAKAIAHRLGKGNMRVEVEANGVRLDPDHWASFFSALVHVVRNALDHGLETPAEREALGKPREGTMVLKARTVQRSLIVEIGDDGRGIDWDAIARKAQKLGLPHRTPADLLASLCSDGVTTRDDVTDHSGRGVGMAAVKQSVESLSGTLEVKSARGAGTTWVFRFPWSPQETPTARLGRAEALLPSPA